MNELPLLRQWARTRNQPVTIFDLETTTNIPHVEWLGITELALVTIPPDGAIEEVAALVDPERHIPPKVRELTGITNQDVRGQPTWEIWKDKLHGMAERHVFIGFNCLSFDCVVVQKQNSRYGLEGTEFSHVLDARALPGVQGNLTKAAGLFGLSAPTAHRALADTWLTAQLVNAVAEKEGLAVLDTHLGKHAAGLGGNYSPRAAREEELLAHFMEEARLPDLNAVAEKHGIKRTTLEGDVLRLIEAGELPENVLDNPAVQDFLSTRLEVAIRETWIGAAEGRLKPLFVFLQGEAPEGFDYTQLKRALTKRKARG